MASHETFFGLDICRRCGATGIDMAEGRAGPECHAPENAVSLEAVRMKRRMDGLFGPVLEQLGFAPTR